MLNTWGEIFAYIWDVIGISLVNWNQTTLQLPLDFTELKFEGVELPFNLGETDQKQVIINCWLVVRNIFYIFPYIGNFIIPADELHHLSEG